MIYDAVGPGVELQLPVAVKSIPVKDWTRVPLLSLPPPTCLSARPRRETPRRRNRALDVLDAA